LIVRLAAGLGVLAAFPFLASGVAQAAMAGANPLTTSNRPDLRTIHTNTSFDTATYCFDKVVANVGAPNEFTLGGYRWDVVAPMQASAVSSSNQQCVEGTVAPKSTYGGTRDLGSYSYGSVEQQAVHSNAGGIGAPGNIADSTANLDSNSHNGTVDHTAGPDLVSVFPPDVTNNRIIFTFDQPVACGTALGNQSSTAPNNLRFLYYDQNGTPHFGVAIGCDSVGDISVQFSTTNSVTNAVRAVVIRGTSPSEGQPQTAFGSSSFNSNNPNCAVAEQGGDPQTCNPTEAVAVPGTGGTTARPDLTSAAIVQSGGNPTNQIDYTFNQPIASASAGDFTAVLSNAHEISGTGEQVLPNNVVRVTFGSALQNIQEMVVKASAYGTATPGPGCAVLSVNLVGGQHVCNTTGGVGVGGNAGAFATGYTTGPDFRSVTFNNSSGEVVLQADQRIDPASVTTGTGCAPNGTGCFWTLIANDGTVVTSTPQSAAVQNNAPYQSQVILTFLTTELSRAVAIQVNGAPFCGNDTWNNGGPFGHASAHTFGDSSSGFSAQGSVCQVLSPTASGAAFADPAKGKVHVRWHYLTKKQIARKMARLRHLKRHSSR
jgi:hypothetical protein